MKVLPTLLSVVFVAFYIAGSIIFAYFLGIIDYGGLPSSLGLWASMVAGGLVAGVLALGVEQVLFSRIGLWPVPPVWFILRMILLAAAWLSLAYVVTTILITLQQIPGPGLEPMSPVAFAAGTAWLFVYMLAPAGLICPFVGLAAGTLLLQANRRRLSLADGGPRQAVR